MKDRNFVRDASALVLAVVVHLAVVDTVKSPLLDELAVDRISIVVRAAPAVKVESQGKTQRSKPRPTQVRAKKVVRPKKQTVPALAPDAVRPSSPHVPQVLKEVPQILKNVSLGAAEAAAQTPLASAESTGSAQRGHTQIATTARVKSEARRARSAPRAEGARTRAKPLLPFVPRYPRQLRDAGIEGFVVLAVEITRHGRTKRVRVVKSLHPALDRLSIAAVMKFTWTPATLDGEPIASRVRYSFRWTIK